MRGESSQRAIAKSSENIGTIVRTDFTKADSSKFGRVVCVLWAVKPALNLAQRAGISERHAQYIIDGRRKPNARVAHVVLGEIIS